MLDFLFFTKNISGNTILFEGEESKHISNSLRKKQDEIINCTDGKGKLYKARIVNIDAKRQIIEASIVYEEAKSPIGNFETIIAISPLKNPERLEWFVEKATELGVNKIIPMISQRTEKPFVRKDRLEKIAISAMKQCLNVYLPSLADPCSFAQVVNEEFDNFQKFIPHCLVDSDDHIERHFNPILNKLILIGPEGDFTQDEIKLAQARGFLPVSLGQRRLRSETAGLFVASLLNN